MRSTTAAILTAVFVAAGCGDTTGPENDRTLDLNAISGSSVTGMATITNEDGPESTVEVALQGFDADTKHAGHVHAGDCSNIGGVHKPLEPVSADGTGEGSAITTSVPDSILKDGYLIAYHRYYDGTNNPDGDGPGAPVVCGAFSSNDSSTGGSY